MFGLFKFYAIFFMAVLISAASSISAAPPNVIINEIHYHPDTGTQMEEFIELYNAGEDIVDLSNWRFSNGIKYKFPPGTMMKAGDYLVVARNPAALQAATGYAKALGPFSGKLNNAGEKITLTDKAGNVIDELTYGDEGDWHEEADGKGPSLELISPLVPNEYGVCWRASRKAFGTPGARNSAFVENPPPIITGTRHDPPVPQPGENVMITSLVIDHSGAVQSVILEYRKDGEPSYNEIAMRDDGRHGDGIAGDNIYGAVVAGLGDGERLDFRIRAKDASGGEALAPPGSPIKTFLCPFSWHVPPGDIPTYRIVMTQANRRELETRDLYSDELLDATFLRDDGKIYYNVGARYRGSSSRKWPKKSYRVNFYKDNPLNDTGATRLTLMAIFPAYQWLSYDLFRRAGVPASDAEFVRVHLNETNMDVYLKLEPVDEDFLSRAFFNEDGGNLYRGVKQGELDYLGESPEPYRDRYLKNTNANIDDWSDLIRLTDILTNAPDEEFAERLASCADLDNWFRFFATHTVLNNWEGGIYNFSGDDYYLYFRPVDGKAVFIPWDMDTTLRGPHLSVWVATVPSTRRFLRHPAFTLPFLKRLRHILDHEFSREIMFQKIDFLPRIAASDDHKKSLKRMVEERHAVIDDEIQSALSIDVMDEYGLCQAFPRKSLWKYFKGTAEPSNGSLDWTRLDFDDSSWKEGYAIFGYGDADDTTDFPDMRNTFLSVYIRKEFYVLNPEDFKHDRAILKVNYNDGYIAYLNGTEIARSNMGEAETFVPYNIPATAIRGVGLYEPKELGSIERLIKPGKNVIAIQGHNADIGDWTFSIDACFFVAGHENQNGREWTISDPGPFFKFQGTANQWKTHRVEFNDQPAPYSFVAGTWNFQSQLDPGANEITVRAFDENGGEIDKLRQTFHRIIPSPESLRVINRDVEWGRENGPIHISSEVFIQRDATLLIREGCEIIFSEDGGIVAEGTVFLAGTPEGKILLSPEKKGGRWKGITVRGVDGCLIVKNAVAESGTFSVIDGAWGIFEDVSIKDNPARTGIYSSEAMFLHARRAEFRDVLTPIHTVGTFSTIVDVKILGDGSKEMILEAGRGWTPENKKTRLPDAGGTHASPDIFCAVREGALTKDENWNVENGPYYIPRELIIPRDITLTIERGTTIFLGVGAVINVRGGLIASGTASEPIRFLGWRGAPWGSIAVSGASHPVRFSHCRFFRSSGDTVAVMLKSSNALIERSIFQSCSRCVEIDSDSFCEFNHNFIIDSLCESQCVHAYWGGTLHVESSVFYDCLDGVEFTGESRKPSFVRNSFFIGGPDDGIDSNGCSILIEGNYVAGFKDKGISLGLPCKTIVRNNLIYNCDIGVAVKQGCEVVMEGNSIVKNRIGILAEASSDTPQFGGGKGTLQDSIVWNNRKSLDLRDNSALGVSYSNVESEEVISGEGNINIDPGFMNLALNDFRLKADSPCVKAGTDGSDMGAKIYSGRSPEEIKAPLPPPPSSVVRNVVRE